MNDTSINFRKLSCLIVSIFVTAQMLSGCAEPAGSGISVTIPSVNINCTTTRCRNAIAAQAYIVYTTSGCTNPAFGETVAGSLALVCNGNSCQGTVSSFTNQAGVSTFTMREGFYSVCAVIDFNSNYIGTAVSGQDTTGSVGDSLVTTGTATKMMTSYLDI